jgi:hypothetical protein
MGVGDKGLRIHKHALSQLASPRGRARRLHGRPRARPEWQRKLAAGILNEHYHQGTPDSRYLVRSVKGTARGVMSDKYRRLDNRPIVDALAHAAQAIGAQPYSGTFSDVRVALKLIIPRVYIAGGDIVAFGLEWGNSDFARLEELPPRLLPPPRMPQRRQERQRSRAGASRSRHQRRHRAEHAHHGARHRHHRERDERRGEDAPLAG